MTDLKASPCGEMSDQGQGPSQKLLRDLLERRGLIEDSSIRNEKARVAEKELRRNMYHNTQVMRSCVSPGNAHSCTGISALGHSCVKSA